MIVVNFSTNQYKIGQERLSNSLNGYPQLMLRDRLTGCPHHRESPYEFKIHAIERAFQRDKVVLWCDASMYLVGDLSRIENLILRDGYFMEEAGHYAGRWTNGRARDYFKVTPEEMNQGPGGITLFSAGLLGLNANSPLAMQFFKQWKASAKAGCFKGKYTDHRHDMTCASIIATRLGMRYQKGNTYMSYIGPQFDPPPADAVFHLLGIV